MRFYVAMWGLLLACLAAHAQVNVEVLLDQEQFLQDESLVIKVRITNRSGQTLLLGKEKDWLTFTVEARDGEAVPKLEEVPVEGEFELESSEMATRRVDLMPHYAFGRPGRYRVSAQIKIKGWNQEITGSPKEFDIIRGTKVWEEVFGVPALSGPPEARKYALVQANNLKQLKLYVRLSDPQESKAFRVVSLGRLVSFSRPEAQLDKECKLHVLFQNGARSFSYNVVNPAGEEVLRQAYDYTETRPVLKAGAEGRILVSGGAQRVAPEDLPTPPPAPPATNHLGKLAN
jgi:hypothetical protein